MPQLTDQNTPEHLEGTPPTTGHRALSALTRVTLMALLGNALAYTAYLLFSLLFSGDFVPYFFIGRKGLVPSGSDGLAGRYSSMDGGPLAGSALD